MNEHAANVPDFNEAHDDLFGPWAAEAALRILSSWPELEPGRRLGPYVIEAKVGRGGMGQVYRALDTRLNRRVALKLVQPLTWFEPSAHRHFFNEARIVAGLNHPNICALFDFGEDGELGFLVMELIEGETLSSRLERGALPLAEVVEIGLALASALSHAHDRGVIHRDLKPANVMSTVWGPKLLDFGIAWERGLTEAATPAGTRRYQSPEQLDGKPDERSDIFSLGAVLYEIAVGSPAFPDGVKCGEIRSECLQQPAEFPAFPPAKDGVNAAAWKRMMDVLRRCLALNPGDRWQNAGDLQRALREVLDLERLNASGNSAARPLRDKRLFAPLTVTIATLLVGIALLLRGDLMAPQIRSLAVLPFEDLSGDARQRYFADGATEELIRELRRLRGLRVISFQSMAQYRNTSKTAREISQELNVDGIIDGGLRRSGGRIVLQTSLSEGGGRKLWSAKQERNLGEAGKLWAEVARSIAEQIRLPMPSGERERLSTLRPVDPGAYQQYVRGRQMCSAIFSGQFEGMAAAPASERALLVLEDSIHKDTGFAPAYAAIALCHWSRGLVGYGRPIDVYPRARDAALRALSLDRSLAEAYAILGSVRRDFDWDWEGADDAFRRGIELDSGDAFSHTQYGIYLALLGRFEEGIEEAKRAAELDPNSLLSTLVLPYSRGVARQYEQAIQEYQALIKRQPEAGPAYAQLTWVYTALGRHAEAEMTYKKARKFFPPGADHLQDSWLLGHMIAQGSRSEAEKLVEAWRSRSARESVDPYNMASMYASLGNTRETMAWLDKAYRERSPSINFIKVEPWLQKFSQQPRYKEILLAMNFPQ